MSENEKDENSLIESQENVEQNDNNFDDNTDSKIEIKKLQSVHYQQKIDELNELLEKRNKNLCVYLQITKIWKNKLLIE